MQNTHSAGTLSLAQLLSDHIQPSSPTPSPHCPRVRSARSRNRAAAWAYDLGQWRRYRVNRETSPERLAEIEAEYACLLAGGPDFAAYHMGSTFADPPVHRLTREDRARVLATFDAIRSGLYRTCRRPRAQTVSANYKAVLGVLLSYAVKKGRVYPSLETIAAAAMVSRSTVLRAIAWLQLFGLLERIRRLTRVRTPLGNLQTRQTSNCYRLNLSLSGLSALALSVFRNGPSATTRLHQLTQGLSKEEKRAKPDQFRFRSP